jgi:hypothetical protein
MHQNEAEEMLRELKTEFITNNTQSFVLHGYGSGDEANGSDFDSGGEDIRYPKVHDIAAIGWEVSGSGWDNDGGGFRMTWNAAAQSLSVVGYGNEIVEEETTHTEV